MAMSTPRRRPTIWIALGVILVIAIAVIFLVSTAGSGSTTSKSSTSSTGTSIATCAGTSTSQTITIISGPVLVGSTGKVAAGVPCADGHLGTLLYYTTGQDISIRVTVPDNLTPIAIQTLFDGNPANSAGTPTPWDVKSTGHAYVLDYGPAASSTLTDTGLHDVYAIVTFADNSTATSNVVYFGVNVPPTR